MNFKRTLAIATAAALTAAPALAQTGAGQPGPAAQAAAPPAAPPMMNPGAVGYRPIVPNGQNIVAELSASGEFTILLKALDANQLTAVVQATPGLTLLAPTDAAFNALPPGTMDNLLKPANSAQLRALLTYHLIHLSMPESQVKGHAATPIPTVQGKPVTIDGSGPLIKVNDANVLQAAVPASNGFIYVIDKVLTPPM